jgi:hypothetical protein
MVALTMTVMGYLTKSIQILIAMILPVMEMRVVVFGAIFVIFLEIYLARAMQMQLLIRA